MKKEIKVELLNYPTVTDWMGVYKRALVTVGKDTNKVPSIEWAQKILKARHSPIRFLRFGFYIECPYWVSVHLCRHIHAQPYVRSQRNDRQSKYDRNKAPQDEMVSMIWDMNAEELITICNKRLCNQTADLTRWVVQQIKDAVVEKCPEFKDELVPICEREHICNEMKPCGRMQTEYSLKDVIQNVHDVVYEQGFKDGKADSCNKGECNDNNND